MELQDMLLEVSAVAKKKVRDFLTNQFNLHYATRHLLESVSRGFSHTL